MMEFSGATKKPTDIKDWQIKDALTTGIGDRQADQEWAAEILRTADPERINTVRKELQNEQFGSFYEDFYGL